MAGRRHRLYVDALRRAGVYERLVAEHPRGMGEACWVCDRRPAKRKLALDHDHGRMYPRGLLCWRCNRVLEHSVTAELLRALADYLDDAAARFERMISAKASVDREP